MSLKYSANTEKSPQPGHHVGLSAASSFLVSGFLFDFNCIAHEIISPPA